MEISNKSNADQNLAEAEAHIINAHQILKAKKIGEHLEIGTPKTKLADLSCEVRWWTGQGLNLQLRA